MSDYEAAQGRFWARVQITDTCWLWTGLINSKGYGYALTCEGQRVLPHRFAYELLVEPIPDGLVIDHLCRVRHCVNPWHLEPVTEAENLVRGLEARRAQPCRWGHDASLRRPLPSGKSICGECSRERDRKRYYASRNGEPAKRVRPKVVYE